MKVIRLITGNSVSFEIELNKALEAEWGIEGQLTTVWNIVDCRSQHAIIVSKIVKEQL